VVLSVAYLFGSPSRVFEDESSKVRAENDWTADQASRYPGRLVAVCSFNPLKSYALAELTRCAADPRLRVGIKLHFGNSDVQLDDSLHVAQLQRVFRAANSHRMAIILHLRASVSRNRPYGPAQARIFLEQVLPAAPDVPIQIAHLAGTGPGYRDPGADSVMATLAEAVATRQSATRNLWFDVATSADTSLTAASAAQIVQRIRRVGASRILYGSDAPLGGNLAPREGWAAFTRLPLTPAELDAIGHNVAPYLLLDSAGVHAR
jgi:predicted TIM-barrel fold metal-dependent hydrolase